ncbi:HAD family hydrolase [Kitasatospora sp. NPDC058965]|uniref:HAD family hydrolase n=1 Tax=Kitasatospora sp. NPDC058965 TaxID=3346682 RepID=UPI00369ABC50
MAIKAVVFDVGETLTSDTRYWHDWAAWLGVPPHTMSALVGTVLARGLDNAEAIRIAKPGCDVGAEWAARRAAGHDEYLDDTDLYPDVRPALQRLKDSGLWVGVAGNQNVRAGECLRRLGLPVDAIAVSAEWGTAKPAREFFERVVAWTALPPTEIVYVGDHPANDIVPAELTGLRTAHLRRGPIGLTTDAPSADWTVDSLDELTDLLVEPV